MNSAGLAVLTEWASALVAHPLVALAAPVIAYLIRGYQARSEARDLIATRLVAVQRDLSELAFNPGGGVEHAGHINALIDSQFSARVRDMRELAGSRALGPKAMASLDQYATSISEYIELWSGRTKGGGNLNTLYDKSRADLHRGLKALGRLSHLRPEIARFENGRRMPKMESAKDSEGRRQKNQLGYMAGEV